MSNTPSEVESQIKEKLDFLFSDENLKNDTFLHEKISSSVDGYVDINTILNLKEVKEKNWTKEDIIKIIKSGDINVELDSTNEKIRRKNNLKLPELTFLSKKRNLEKSEEILNESEDCGTIVLKISCGEQPSFSDKIIFDTFKKLNPELIIEYQLFNNISGYFVIKLKKEQKYENLNIYKNNKLKIEDKEFIIEKITGDELNNFWKEHVNEYENYINHENQIKNGVSQPRKKIQLIFGGKRYCNVGLIKEAIKIVLSRYKVNDKLSKPDQAFILDLFKYHDEYDERIKDLDYVMVGSNERFRYLKNFYIVDKNQNRRNCSPKKCIDNLIERMNREANL